MKKIATLSLLLAAPFALSSCSMIMNWYRKFTKVVTMNNPFAITIQENDDFRITLKVKDGLSITDDYHMSSSKQLVPSSYNPDTFDFVYKYITHGEEEIGFRHIGDDLRDDENKYYYAFAFDMTIEKTNTSDSRNYILIDQSNSEWEVSSKTNTAMMDGMRVGFIVNDPRYTNNVVWAPLQDSNQCRHMLGTGEEVPYSEEVRLLARDTMVYEWEINPDGVNCIGHFDEDKNKITTTVAIWLEGTDPNVTNVNISDDLAIKMRMAFNLR